ncbi:hypothetical protein VB264_01700 [Arcicella aquatica]|uniref:Uncharacterized protein n=1 Tax=Arcicella aquatica TaxID=217141 RepID=A0ABU5QJ06_9BACT|nr:hypothetical protein [Arcicella aquatica]MEA5256476.1 hypothetical protein [Arcicella aquatica]
MELTSKHILFCIKCTFLILFLIKITPVSANINCTNQSFFVNQHSAGLINNPLLSSKNFEKLIGFSCQNINNSSKRYKTLKDLKNHAYFFSLENLILGFDDSDVEEEHVQKKTKSTKRNRAGYITRVCAEGDSFLFDLGTPLKTKGNFIYKDAHYLDVIILFHSPPPESLVNVA